MIASSISRTDVRFSRGCTRETGAKPRHSGEKAGPLFSQQTSWKTGAAARLQCREIAHRSEAAASSLTGFVLIRLAFQPFLRTQLPAWAEHAIEGDEIGLVGGQGGLDALLGKPIQQGVFADPEGLT